MSARRAEHRWAEARLFALPAARLTALLAGLLLAAAMLAGALRVLPLLLAEGVPLRVAPVLARGALAVALEVALFVAPPLAWALAASRMVDRGEARALFAMGVTPLRVVAGGSPVILAVAAAAGLASAAWGREARAPGRAVREMVAEARSACVNKEPPASIDVPLIGVSWVCLEGESPRAVGLVGRAAFAASSVVVSDDLRRLSAENLTLVLPSATPEGAARVHVKEASIRGLSPLGRASNLSVPARVVALAGSAAALSVVAAALTLLASLRSRVAALALGASGPAASLLVFSALEREPSHAAGYVAVPAAGLAALAAAALAVRRAQRGGAEMR